MPLMPTTGTLLHHACKIGKLPFVTRLIHHGADITVGGSHGESPLHLACGYGHLDVARILIQNGADVSAVDGSGCTPRAALLCTVPVEADRLMRCSSVH